MNAHFLILSIIIHFLFAYMVVKDFQPIILTCIVIITHESHHSISGSHITGQGTQVKEQMLGATSTFSFLAFRVHDIFRVTL